MQEDGYESWYVHYLLGFSQNKHKNFAMTSKFSQEESSPLRSNSTKADHIKQLFQLGQATVHTMLFKEAILNPVQVQREYPSITTMQ
jgi:hypothetical protein